MSAAVHVAVVLLDGDTFQPDAAADGGAPIGWVQINPGREAVQIASRNPGVLRELAAALSAAADRVDYLTSRGAA